MNANPNSGQATQKTTQVMVVTSETKPIPASQRVELMAFFDTAGKPLLGLSSSPAKVPNKITLANASGTVAVDASTGNYGTITLTASGWTIANPTNPSDGQEITIGVRQGGSGSYTVTWAAKYDFGGVGGTPTLSTAVGKLDFFKFIYDLTLDKWCCVVKAIGE